MSETHEIHELIAVVDHIKTHGQCIYCGKPKGKRNMLICGVDRDCYRRLVRDRMLKTLAKHAGNVQKFVKNPSWTTTEQGRARLRKIALTNGHKPSIRGGFGKPLPKQQKALSEALGWPCDVGVKTGSKNRTVLKTWFSLDIANIQRKIAVEVDGPSHRNPKARAQDAKKDNWLRNNGWTIFRFKNKAVDDNISLCVSTILSSL